MAASSCTLPECQIPHVLVLLIAFPCRPLLFASGLVGTMAMSKMCSQQCSCGRWYSGKNAETVRVTLYRCQQKHTDASLLSFPRQTIQTSNLLWVILSHQGGRHNARELKLQLQQAGVPMQLLMVKRTSTAKLRMETALWYNELVMFNFLHRWLPAVGTFLSKTSKTILGVVYIECTARCEFWRVSELLPAINKQTSRPLKWLGYRKFHRAKPERNRHGNPVYEGSKLLAFTGSSLSHVRKHYLKSKRYSHLDLFLCRVLDPSYFYAPPTSFTSSCRHVSVCGGSESGPIIRAKEPVGSRPMKRPRK